MDILELLKDILQIVAFTVITGAGTIIVRKISDFLNNKIDEVQTTTKLADYEKLNMVIDSAQKIVNDIVVAINQTFVDSLKASGKFDKESATIAKDAAMDKAKELLSEDAIKIIEDIYGDIDSFLDIQIEAIVNKLKQNKTN